MTVSSIDTHQEQSFREQVGNFIENPAFEKSIILLIVINAIVMGLETSASISSSYGNFLTAIDHGILAVFIAEITLRLVHNFKGFWKDPWRIFDFAVVAIALVPATGSLSVLRALRILRVLRLVSSIKSLRKVVTGLLSALPGMSSIILLLSLIFYIFAVIATKLFAEDFPQWFGSLGASAYTLFQIMTLESWSMGIVRPVMEQYPYAWILFVPFIIVTAFTVLNLFIGVIVNALQTEHEMEAKAEREAMKQDSKLIINEIRQLRSELANLKTNQKQSHS